MEKSLEFCNSELFWTSLEQINRELSPLECLSYLELAVSQEVKSEESNIYYVEKVFEKLYEQLDLLQYKERIAPLEFKFLQLKAFENGSCFHSIIKEDPGLYASCIDMLYKHEDGKEPDKKEINMSTVFDIFHTLNFCPGETNGSIDEPVLRNWVSEFQRLLEKQHQSLLFHSFLGRLLAHSPAGDDCYEPHEAVRRLIEEIYQADIKESFYIERLNMRGIYNVTDGRDDKILADKYRANAKALFQNYPKVASIYSLLAENYEKKAKEARKQAEQVDGY
ncbi:MAG: hypothetical protein JJE17_12790 [Peptostreptococcaceae bacterium]|nr:hypothetical protein [Peptostreptococcaceae bacterium]